MLCAASQNREFFAVEVTREVMAVLEEVLNLRGRAVGLSIDTPLLGSIPELDSMAVVSIVAALEERFGFVAEDDELDASIFQTVGSLAGFVRCKVDS
jgi:acyl carrier protein